jgi:hypothetical protein
MKIHVKAFIDGVWGNPEYVVFREGEYQHPLAMLSEPDLAFLEAGIKDARKAVREFQKLRQMPSGDE